MKKINLTERYDALLRSNNIQIFQDSIWAYPQITSNITDNYGWKIHISAVITNAIYLAEKFFRLNKLKKWDFKIISSISNLEKINMGYYGNSQVGKFITIYPDQSKVVDSLETLYYTFHNDVGIRVGSDFSYKLSSCIYYRFGTLLNDVKQIDHRDKTLKPFKNAAIIPDYELKHFHELPKKYLVIKELKHLGPTGVFLGIDALTREKIIIRYASRFYNLEVSKVDENDRLLSASWLLHKKDILTDSGFETLLDTFYIDNSVFMITKYINGYTFDRLACNNSLSKFTKYKKIKIFNQLLYLINKLNDSGITFRDLSFSNVLLDENDEVKLIDFNYAISSNGISSFAGCALSSAGTYGFYDPKIQKTMKYSDRFSLAKFLYFLMYPKKYVKFMEKVSVDTNYQEIKRILKDITSQPLPSKSLQVYYNQLISGRKVEYII